MKIIHLFVLISFIGGFSASSCNFEATLAYELRNQGFHRNITYKVTFSNKYGESHLDDNCYVGIDQILPAGVYAYPDELGDLQRMNKLTAFPKNRVNVELPAEQSQPTSVYIIGKLQNREAYLWLPVHARYHKAVKGGGLYHNEIQPPIVYLRCPHINLEKCEPKTPLITFYCTGNRRGTCTWKEIASTLLTEPTIEMSVPVGNLDHNDIVAPATFGAVVICSLYLLKTLHEYKRATRKKLKF